MISDLNHQNPLITAILDEMEFINQTITTCVSLEELRELTEVRFKKNLTQHLFPNQIDSDIFINTKLEESDLKNAEEYFTLLSTIPPSLQESTYNFVREANGNLTQQQIDKQVKLIKAKKSELINFISQIYTLKKEEIYDKLKSLQDFENTLDRTRKAYITNTDLKKLKEFENINTENKLKYTNHIAYLTICEQGMKQVTESCFNLALLAVVGK